MDSVDIRIPWPHDPGTLPIPDGFTRDDAFAGRYLQGGSAAFVGSTNGGGSHTHVDPGHTHVGDSHRHEFYAEVGSYLGALVQEIELSAYISSGAVHGHVAEDSHWAEITYGTEAATINSGVATPPYLTTIMLQPDAIDRDMPVGAMCFTADETPPDRYATVDGDWDGLYLHGWDPLLTWASTGGSATHGHTSVAHNHTPDPHVHTATLCGSATDQVGTSGDAAVGKSTAPPKHHLITLQAPSPVLDDVSDAQVTVQDATFDPAHVKLLGLVKNSAATGERIPAGVIVPFVGDPSELPSEWVLCDGNNGTPDCTDRQVKITTSAGAIGQTGGDDNHTHTVTDHGHVHTGSHDHPVGDSLIKQIVEQDPESGTVLYTKFGHGAGSHTWIVEAVQPTMQDASITLGSSDGRGPYRTVMWVMRVPAAPAPPIERAEPRDEWIPGHDWINRPEEDYVPDSRGPWETPPRGWSANRCGTVLFGTCVVPEGECQECGTPIYGVLNCPNCGTPFDRSGGVDPDAGSMRPITAHPVRAMSLLATHGNHNEELCRHHMGRFAVNGRGDTVIKFCHRPDAGGDTYEGEAKFYCNAEGDDYIEAGNTGGVGAMQLPTAIVGILNSYGPACGEPI